ncbi:MAG: polysaccharide biosynthesis/export family protein [Prolixibacteraceae bacterium]
MRQRIKSLLFGLIIGTFIFSSCVPLKDYVYLQGDLETSDLEIAEPAAYRIQSNDNLYIQVISNDELSMYFNLSSTDRYLNNDAAIELGSYKVDANGEIDFPYVGNVVVKGLTTSEVKEIISTSIAERLVQYSVVVKLVNRSVSLLGEFNTPGTYSFYKDQMTIFEAIGMGHDITDFGNRHKVKVIRHVNGQKNVTNIDLTSTEIFKSEYYYILPNDIVYVEPTNRVYGAKTLPFATILTTINTIVLLYNAVNNATK